MLARDITAEQYRFVAKRRALQCLDDPFSGEEFDVPEEELNYLKKYFLGKNNRVADKSRKENDRLDISAEEGSDKEGILLQMFLKWGQNNFEKVEKPEVEIFKQRIISPKRNFFLGKSIPFQKLPNKN